MTLREEIVLLGEEEKISFINYDNTISYKLIINGKEISKADFIIGKKTIYISGVMTKSDYRNKGYMKKLLKYSIAELRTKYPKHKVTLEVEQNNVAAINLYKSLGFNENSQTGKFIIMALE